MYRTTDTVEDDDVCTLECSRTESDQLLGKVKGLLSKINNNEYMLPWVTSLNAVVTSLNAGRVQLAIYEKGKKRYQTAKQVWHLVKLLG